ncbi:sel1 repeat family protein [uncultured Campylobacter sp.]|uniref:tetratricopeptide repeat protein n=1 Tax=uncultured Campylobacter sp. TaxID=218934 RepID=UPI002636DED5|nr:sel1 repeat family protein [uncultured Campylobacter sp.]
MKKFLFLALFCALAANCDKSARADKISAADKTDKTTSIGETATRNAHFLKSGEVSAGSQSSADAVIQTDGISRADLQSCIVKSDEGSCERVARGLKSGCERKDQLSCFFYADALGRGLGVEKDVVASFELFREQCDAGSSEACYELSVKYLQGIGTPQSFELSGQALDRACKMHNKRACAVLDLLPKN